MRPMLSETRQLAHRQRLDPRVLDQSDERGLKRFQLADRKSCSAEDQMRLRMRGCGAIERKRRFALNAAIDIGHSYQRPRNSRTPLRRLTAPSRKASQQRRA